MRQTQPLANKHLRQDQAAISREKLFRSGVSSMQSMIRLNLAPNTNVICNSFYSAFSSAHVFKIYSVKWLSLHSGDNTVSGIADSCACSLEQTGDPLYLLLENPAPLHCSRLLCLLFRLQCFGHQTRQDLQGEEDTQKAFFPSAPCVSICIGFVMYSFFCSLSRISMHSVVFLAIQDSCLVCTELVLFSAHTCVQVTIVTDNALVTHLIKTHPEKKMSLCSRNASDLHQ